jgi:serine/threonine protein kinase
MSLSNLYDSYIQSEIEWENISKTNIGPNSILLSASPHNLDTRTYRYQDRVIKIRKINSNNIVRSKLQNEYKVLLHLEKRITGFDFEPKYTEIIDYDLLSMNYRNGILLERYLEMKEISISHLFKAALELLRINLKGVSHRDVTTSNIKVSEIGDLVFIDFDQAIITSPFKACLNDFLGIALGIPRAIHPYRRIVQRIILRKIPQLAKLANLLHGTHSKENRPIIVLKLSQTSQMKPSLLKLKEAWSLAAQSNANSPGETIAYYSLCLDGFGFLGERSWESRWKAIKDIIPFKGKRVLELGCNIGLFSTFIRLQGAEKCVGLDIDKDIIKSARLVASAFDVDNVYAVENLDEESWSEKYQDFDLVIALSVLNWLKNKKEFLKFLSKYRELIYEGHDSFQVEYDRLIACGYDLIQIISVSERGRIVFYAKK